LDLAFEHHHSVNQKGKSEEVARASGADIAAMMHPPLANIEAMFRI